MGATRESLGIGIQLVERIVIQATEFKADSLTVDDEQFRCAQPSTLLFFFVFGRRGNFGGRIEFSDGLVKKESFGRRLSIRNCWPKIMPATKIVNQLSVFFASQISLSSHVAERDFSLSEIALSQRSGVVALAAIHFVKLAPLNAVLKTAICFCFVNDSSWRVAVISAVRVSGR